MKTCTKCLEVKPLDSFHRRRDAADGMSPQCKDCRKERQRAYRKSHYEEMRAYEKARNATPKQKLAQRNSILKRKYGISKQDFDNRFEAQGKACLICKSTDKRPSNYCVDHNHVTLEVRGIVCRKCNTAMGQMNDDPLLLRAAARYLEEAAKNDNETVAEDHMPHKKMLL